jgi:hypothetical protein
LCASGRFTIRARSRTTRSSTETPPTNTCAHLSVVSAKFLSSTDGWWRLGPVCYPRGQLRQTHGSPFPRHGNSKGGRMADPRELSEPSIGRYLVYAGPVLWAVLIVFHPNPGGDSPMRARAVT